jgi:inward rectifier potassium channel
MHHQSLNDNNNNKYSEEDDIQDHLLSSMHQSSYQTIDNNNSHESITVMKHESQQKSFRLVSRSKKFHGHFNLSKQNIPFLQKLSTLRDSYHVLLSIKWWKLFSAFFIIYLIIHLLFGLLYYMGGKKALENTDHNYWECVFFSVQTFSTIGYGKVYPSSYYANCIVCIESFVALFVESFVISLVIGKFTRPSLLKRQIVFSNVAVVNNLNFEGNVDPTHRYISFRFINLQKSQFVDAHFRLLLLTWKYEDENETERELNVKITNKNKRRPVRPLIYELDFQINVQKGRAYGIDHASPILPLPWLVVHRVNAQSPLFHLIDNNNPNNKDKLKRIELVAVYDAIDEATSHNVQSRFSYTRQEIIFNAKFESCVFREKGRFVVDHDKMDHVIRC